MSRLLFCLIPVLLLGACATTEQPYATYTMTQSDEQILPSMAPDTETSSMEWSDQSITHCDAFLTSMEIAEQKTGQQDAGPMTPAPSLNTYVF